MIGSDSHVIGPLSFFATPIGLVPAGNALPCAFLNLPDNLVELVGHAVFAHSPCGVLRLCQACLTLRTKLEVVRLLAEMRRLSWLPKATSKHFEISDEGRTLTVVSCNDSIQPWVTGRLLPTVGKSAWKVRVDRSNCNDGNGMCVGVCDAEAHCSWGLFLYSGRLRCISRDEDGKLDYGPPLEGYPNGNYTTIVMKDEAGQRTNLQGRANGAMIEVLLDHDVGTLGYHINGSPYLAALPFEIKDRGNLKRKPTTFPQGAALRPYASCYYLGDRLSFVTAHV